MCWADTVLGEAGGYERSELPGQGAPPAVRGAGAAWQGRAGAAGPPALHTHRFFTSVHLQAGPAGGHHLEW